jgi:glutathione synthase/RimK-type ligase-like ATP-grasp enzyme
VGNRFNLTEIVKAVGLPCVLKYPDSAFSQGVSRYESEEELMEKASGILEVSDLFVAQEFVPTAFDWRVGVFEDQPLYACRYHMVDQHWQIVRHHGQKSEYGKIEPVPLDLVPSGVVGPARLARRHGLYGVDIKRIGRKSFVREVSPNIDHGYEDSCWRQALPAHHARPVGARARAQGRTRRDERAFPAPARASGSSSS